MLLLFKTLVELFGYPGRERWQWRRFIDKHRDMLTDDEYKTAVRWLLTVPSTLDLILLKLDPELGDK